MKQQNARKRNIQRPDLIVPYFKEPLMHRALPYLIFGGIIAITIITIVVISVKGAR